jgi:hypothetical protein
MSVDGQGNFIYLDEAPEIVQDAIFGFLFHRPMPRLRGKVLGWDDLLDLAVSSHENHSFFVRRFGECLILELEKIGFEICSRLSCHHACKTFAPFCNPFIDLDANFIPCFVVLADGYETQSDPSMVILRHIVDWNDVLGLKGNMFITDIIYPKIVPGKTYFIGLLIVCTFA